MKALAAGGSLPQAEKPCQRIVFMACAETGSRITYCKQEFLPNRPPLPAAMQDILNIALLQPALRQKYRHIRRSHKQRAVEQVSQSYGKLSAVWPTGPCAMRKRRKDGLENPAWYEKRHICRAGHLLQHTTPCWLPNHRQSACQP